MQRGTHSLAMLQSCGADYVMGLKGNQGTAHREIAEFFTHARANDCRDIEHTFHEAVDGSEHGRLEVRRTWATQEEATIYTRSFLLLVLSEASVPFGSRGQLCSIGREGALRGGGVQGLCDEYRSDGEGGLAECSVRRWCPAGRTDVLLWTFGAIRIRLLDGA